MARTLDPEAHAIRREAFIDAAERLIQTKGYEQMSIQDVLDETEASRGAFYHYFDSKAALLEAVVERTVRAAIGAVEPLVADPDVPALQKLQGIFAGISRWKMERTDLMRAILEIWIADGNALMRDKMWQGLMGSLAPLLASAIKQGKEEGVFTASLPDAAARVLIALIRGTNEAAVQLYVERAPGSSSYEAAAGTAAAFVEALERILGAPAGSLTLVDDAALRQWFE